MIEATVNTQFENYPEKKSEEIVGSLINQFGALKGFGETGEFVIGKMGSEKIIFLFSGLLYRGESASAPDAVAWSSNFAEPMRQALQGKTGVMTGLDYDGVKVMGAYTPLPSLGWGLVAKRRISEIEAPFIKAAGISSIAVLVLLLLGALLVRQTSASYAMELAEVNRRLNTAQEFAKIGFADFDLENNQSWSSKGFQGLMGAKSSCEKTFKGFLSCVHPDDREKVANAIYSPVHGSRTYSLTFRILKDDQERYLYMHGNSEFNDRSELIRFKGMFQDFTETREQEDALRTSEEQLVAIMTHSPFPIFLKDTNGLFKMVNRKFCEWSSLSEDQILNKTSWEIFKDEKVAEQYLSMDANILENGDISVCEIVKAKSDGGNRESQLTKFPIFNSEGDITGIGGIEIDLSEIRKAQQQLYQASKLATLGEMASGIAHELNQPLSIIRMASENALAGVEAGSYTTERLIDRFNDIVSQSDRMAMIINHMRQFSRIGSDAHEPFDVNKAVRQATQLLENQLTLAGIRLSLDLEDEPAYISGVSLHLEQVVLNFLSNARDATVEYMKNQPVECSEEQPEIRLSSHYDNQAKKVYIAVEDDAGGIPDNILPHIFDPFFTTKPEGTGTGLGLSISYSLINGMNGAIEAISTETGMRFQICFNAVSYVSSETTIPGHETTEVKETSIMNTNEKNDESSLAKESSVLIVDDEEIASQSIAEYLERKGYVVHTASNGQEAIQIFENNNIDSVVTDLRMPEMDGNELVHLIRKKNQDIPIVVATGHTTLGDEKEIVSEGASAVLRKPIRLKELSNLLSELV